MEDKDEFDRASASRRDALFRTERRLLGNLSRPCFRVLFAVCVDAGSFGANSGAARRDAGFGNALGSLETINVVVVVVVVIVLFLGADLREHSDFVSWQARFLGGVVSAEAGSVAFLFFGADLREQSDFVSWQASFLGGVASADSRDSLGSRPCRRGCSEIQDRDCVSWQARFLGGVESRDALDFRLCRRGCPGSDEDGDGDCSGDGDGDSCLDSGANGGSSNEDVELLNTDAFLRRDCRLLERRG